MIYFDTAYLVKCYVNETGSPAVRALAETQPTITCCQFGRLELVAALHRKLRENEITPEQFSVILRQVELDDQQGVWHWMDLDDDLLERAVGFFSILPANIYLRSADALHLATAQISNAQAIYSNDRHLLSAATALGIVARNVI